MLFESGHLSILAWNLMLLICRVRLSLSMILVKVFQVSCDNSASTQPPLRRPEASSLLARSLSHANKQLSEPEPAPNFLQAPLTLPTPPPYHKHTELHTPSHMINMLIENFSSHCFLSILKCLLSVKFNLGFWNSCFFLQIVLVLVLNKLEHLSKIKSIYIISFTTKKSSDKRSLNK